MDFCNLPISSYRSIGTMKGSPPCQMNHNRRSSDSGACSFTNGERFAKSCASFSAGMTFFSDRCGYS
jgi:hypothetical protein